MADERGYHVLLFNTAENTDREHQVLQTMREHRLRGIIITPVSEQDPDTMKRLHNFETLGIPVVLLDREVDSQFFDRVVTDDERGVYAAVSELTASATAVSPSHRPRASRPGAERLRRLLPRTAGARLAVTPAYIRKGDFMVDCAYEQTLALCAMQEPPTAVFSSNNMTTYGCLKAFNELGLRVGADIALVGFDDIDALCWLDYNISVVSRDVPEMGQQAMRLLLQRFESERGERAGARECLPTELLLRGSELLPESGRAH